ncbi:hypothetical protein K7432_008990 [Basidiobolus ranarum]|uniref:Uncharacterized protein n=1 Tax=Basidiobolus ranarum TaxID=34480 RepID=A0ABR2VXR7_9FUNG
MSVVTPVPKPNYADLVSVMTGRDCLNGWDVLVSYDEDTINNLLSHSAQKIGFLKPITFDFKYTDDRTEEEITVYIEINMKNPTLQFSTTADEHITLLCPFTGSYSYSDRPTKPKTFPDGLQLLLDVSLVNVSGTVSGTDFTPSSQENTAKSNEIVLIPVDNQVAQGVCLDLRNVSPTLINTPSGNTTPGNLSYFSSLIKDGITRHFRDSTRLSLYLGGISNVAPPNGDIVLKPNAFCFSIIPAGKDPNNNTKNIPGVLCTWISVEGSAGSLKQGNGHIFQPNNIPMNPIPSESMASVIFSHNCLANMFFVPGLKSALDNVSCTSVPGKIGMTFSGNLPSSPINVAEDDDHSVYGGHHFDGCHTNLNTPAATITIGASIVSNPTPEKPTPPIKLDWSSQNFTLNWNTYTTGEGATHKDGAIDCTFKYSGSANWSSPASDPNSLHVDFNMNSEIKAEMNPEHVSKWSKFGGGSDSFPSEYKHLPRFGFSMMVPMKGLSYLLTTNLLFPGKNIFIADSPVTPDSGNLKDKIGLACPRDTVLTGNINQDAAGVIAARLKAMKQSYQNDGLTPSSLNPEHTNGSNAPNSDGHLKLNRSSSVPTMNDPAMISGTSLIDAFKDDIFSEKASPILCEMFQVAANTTVRNYENMLDVIDKSQYKGLTDDELMGMYGLTLYDIFPDLKDKNATNNMGPTAVDAAAMLDIRAFGGYYTVQNPVSDAGKVLYINAVTGGITFSGVQNVIPTRGTDSTSGQPTNNFIFTANGKKYAIVLSASLDEFNLFQTSFSGTRQDPMSGAIESFNGKLKKIAPPLDVLEGPSFGYEETGQFHESDLHPSKLGLLDGWDTFANINGIIGLAGTVIGIVGCCFACYWQRQASRAERRLDLHLQNIELLIEDGSKRNREDYSRMTNNLQKEGNARAERELRQNFDSKKLAEQILSEGGDCVDADVKREIDKLTEEQKKILAETRPEDLVQLEEFKHIFEIAREKMRARMKAAVDNCVGATLDDFVKNLKDKKIVENIRADEIASEAKDFWFKKQINPIIMPNNLNLLDTHVGGQLADEGNRIRDTVIKNIEDRIEQRKKEIDQRESSILEQADKIEKVKSDIKDAKTKEEKLELEKKKAQLEEAIDKMNKKQDSETKKQQDEIKEHKNAEIERKNSQKSREKMEKKEKAAKERLKKI